MNLTKALNKTVWFVSRSPVHRCPCKLPGVETVRVTHAGRIVCRLLRDASVIWVKMNKWTQSWWRGLFPLHREYCWITAKITNKYKILMMPVGKIQVWSVKGLLGCGCAVTGFYSLPQLKPRASGGEKFCAVHDGRLWPAVSLQFAGGLGEAFILTVFLKDCFETSGFLNDITHKGEPEWNSPNKWSKRKYVVQDVYMHVCECLSLFDSWKSETVFDLIKWKFCLYSST